MAKAKVLSKDEAKRVLRIAETSSHGQRDKLALALSILGGMRVGEIATLKIGDVRGLDGRAVEVVHLTRHQTKGNRSRRVFLGDELRKHITHFLSYSTNLPDGAALIRSSRTGKHMCTVTLSTRLKGIYRAAGIDTSSHAGRRTFATRKNEIGIGMATIQQLMGHSSIQTTALYCHVSDEQLRNAANAG
ncbi:tyrosine-type recombinase/integrase [Novosphingobium fuchskuhlense]|uniref:tyrosine-type recombinase/integrase n=1 Tax=Novosphingobium fuchskuhlense TaxID=1117702 RepID=UPI000A407D21|nr:site-specific integrase [Novosphingobium fuchskuhlense]